MTTYIHKVKCLMCGLHYAAYSWREDWQPKTCPECGAVHGMNIRWREESDQQVFEFIPGKAAMVGMDVSDRL